MIGTKAGKSVGKVEIPEGPLEATGMIERRQVPPHFSHAFIALARVVNGTAARAGLPIAYLEVSGKFHDCC
jgi:hypothetical protein